MELVLSVGQKAYHCLAALFSEPTALPLEIEILPRSLLPLDGQLLRDGICIGIPEKVLIYGFAFASKIAWNSADEYDQIGADAVCGEDNEAAVRDQSPISLEPLTSRSVVSRAAVTLLYDPEHLTATNSLKRCMKIKAAGQDENSLETSLQYQLWLLDTLHTSPLNKHTKSPTLWYHRLWLLSNYWKIYASLRLRAAPKRSLLQHELDVIFQAGNRHPKNYYAWNYARELVQLLDNRDCASAEILTVGVYSVHDWCLKHPSDVSGWSFLLFLLQYLKDATKILDITQRTINFAVSFRWTGDVIWGFIGEVAVCRKYLTAEQRLGLRKRLVDLAHKIDGGCTEGKVRVGNGMVALAIRKVVSSD